MRRTTIGFTIVIQIRTERDQNRRQTNNSLLYYIFLSINNAQGQTSNSMTILESTSCMALCISLMYTNGKFWRLLEARGEAVWVRSLVTVFADKRRACKHAWVSPWRKKNGGKCRRTIFRVPARLCGARMRTRSRCGRNALRHYNKYSCNSRASQALSCDQRIKVCGCIDD